MIMARAARVPGIYLYTWEINKNELSNTLTIFTSVLLWPVNF